LWLLVIPIFGEEERCYEGLPSFRHKISTRANAPNVVSRASSKTAQQLQRPGYLRHFFVVFGNTKAAVSIFL
jgi:hypothetical protein